MTNREIIDRASRIVCAYLETAELNNEIDVKMNKKDLIEVFSALAIAGHLCRFNNCDDSLS